MGASEAISLLSGRRPVEGAPGELSPRRPGGRTPAAGRADSRRDQRTRAIRCGQPPDGPDRAAYRRPRLFLGIPGRSAARPSPVVLCILPRSVSTACGASPGPPGSRYGGTQEAHLPVSRPIHRPAVRALSTGQAVPTGRGRTGRRRGGSCRGIKPVTWMARISTPMLGMHRRILLIRLVYCEAHRHT
jgi:hypothetical protein